MKYPTLYDADISRACARWWPLAPWRRVKAQLIAESNLKPNAESEAGAKGLAQFIDEAWPQWREFCGYEETVSPFEPVAAINCCCAYMAHLYNEWHAPRPEIDKWALALASYNAGLGNILHAQRLPGDQTAYASIISRLPQVTGHNAEETQNYVTRIKRIYEELTS